MFCLKHTLVLMLAHPCNEALPWVLPAVLVPSALPDKRGLGAAAGRGFRNARKQTSPVLSFSYRNHTQGEGWFIRKALPLYHGYSLQIWLGLVRESAKQLMVSVKERAIGDFCSCRLRKRLRKLQTKDVGKRKNHGHVKTINQWISVSIDWKQKEG